jgi:hypothetical protein
VRAETSLKSCRQPYCLAPGTAELRPAMGLLFFKFLSLADSQDCPKNCVCRGLSKAIHTVSLRPCQEKFFAFNGQPAIFGSLKHTSNGTLELDHDAWPPVNSFTPNRLILTFFNEDPAGRGRPVLPSTCKICYNTPRYQSLSKSFSQRFAGYAAPALVSGALFRPAVRAPAMCRDEP